MASFRVKSQKFTHCMKPAIFLNWSGFTGWHNWLTLQDTWSSIQNLAYCMKPTQKLLISSCFNFCSWRSEYPEYIFLVLCLVFLWCSFWHFPLAWFEPWELCSHKQPSRHLQNIYAESRNSLLFQNVMKITVIRLKVLDATGHIPIFTIPLVDTLESDKDQKSLSFIIA